MAGVIPSNTLYAADIDPVTEARFWSFVKIDWKPDACWLWQGACENHYGRFKLGKKRAAVNRIMLALRDGAIHQNIFACHMCDTPMCVRPDHLFHGTQAENKQDEVQKGRNAHGSRAGGAKLTEDQVHQIKQRKGTVSARALGQLFGVQKTTIQKILSGKNWTRVQCQ